jgi:hypothetical protein
MSLANELPIADINHDDLVALLASSLPIAQWRYVKNTVVCSSEAGEAVVTLTYEEGRLLDVEAGPGLSYETRKRLRDDAAALALPHETVVWRDVFFSILPVDGYWRYREDWQIVPIPPQAPRANGVMLDNPLIVELRVPSYPGQGMLNAVIHGRRAWELQLMLNLVLHGPVKWFGRRAFGKTWAHVQQGDGGHMAELVQPGYSIPDWINQSSRFTPVDGLLPLPKVSDSAYFSRRGIDSDDVFEIPEVLDSLLDASGMISVETRDRFLRACYWYDRSGAAWKMSVSLGHIAAVNAIETIMQSGRAPGVTRRFHDFVERYAPRVPKENREQIYDLRSRLVHGDQLFDIDRPWPAFIPTPRNLQQQDMYQAAQMVARAVIINWLLDQCHRRRH